MSSRTFARARLAMCLVLVGGLIVLTGKAALGQEKDKPKEVICQRLKFLVDGKEQPLTIRVGESVVWVNKDNAEHDATPKGDSSAKFTAVDIPKKDRSKPVKFTKAGTYKYYCTVHDDMEGTIIVKE